MNAAAAIEEAGEPLAEREPSCIRQHTSAYVSIRQHTSAFVSIRQRTSAYVSMRQHASAIEEAGIEEATGEPVDEGDAFPSNQDARCAASVFVRLYQQSKYNRRGRRAIGRERGRDARRIASVFVLLYQ